MTPRVELHSLLSQANGADRSLVLIQNEGSKHLDVLEVALPLLEGQEAAEEGVEAVLVDHARAQEATAGEEECQQVEADLDIDRWRVLGVVAVVQVFGGGCKHEGLDAVLLLLTGDHEFTDLMENLENTYRYAHELSITKSVEAERSVIPFRSKARQTF